MATDTGTWATRPTMAGESSRRMVDIAVAEAAAMSVAVTVVIVDESGVLKELEHGIMCQYLFAAFSLKQATEEGLTQQQLSAVTRWRQQVSHVATQEMLHLALVHNLLSAIGAAPHLGLPLDRRTPHRPPLKPARPPSRRHRPDPASFAAHIKPPFRATDRQSMSFAFDLWTYEGVRTHAADILDRLRSGSMPCDGAWPGDKVDIPSLGAAVSSG